MAEWLKGCEVCNAGLCSRFKELIDSGMSQRAASLALVEEQKNDLGEVVYPAETLRKRYQRNMPSNNMGTNVPTPDEQNQKELRQPVAPEEKGKNKVVQGGPKKQAAKKGGFKPHDGEAAMLHARMAIADLEMINKYHPDSQQAFDFVLDWINKNRYLRG